MIDVADIVLQQGAESVVRDSVIAKDMADHVACGKSTLCETATHVAKDEHWISEEALWRSHCWPA